MTTKIDITWPDVVALAPELAAVSQLGQAQLLAQASMEINVDKWGGLEHANAAGLWLTRHLATVGIRRGQGALTAVSVGQVSKSFANPMSLAALQSTSYGAEYLRLVRLFLPRFALT